MRASDKQRPNATGRDDKRTGSKNAVIILKRSFWLSPQVSVLSPTARALLIELTAMYTGPLLNGRLFLSVRDAAGRLGLSCLRAASNAIDELVVFGFMTETVKGHFSPVGGHSKARAFRINWKDDRGSPTSADPLPDLDFQQLTTRQKRRVETRSKALAAHAKGNFPVEVSSTVGAIRAAMVAEVVEASSTVEVGNRENPPICSDEDSSTHIYYQGGLGSAMPRQLPPNLKTAFALRHRPGRKASGPQSMKRRGVTAARFPPHG